MTDGYSTTDLSVFTAKYDYNPLESSPNKQPELELALTANEHVIVYGNTNIVSNYIIYQFMC